MTKPIVTDEMVKRFLAWPLPASFNPDCGITFKRTYNEDSPYGPAEHEPTGTNLLDAMQARAMLEHVLALAPVAGGVPAEPVPGDAMMKYRLTWQEAEAICVRDEVDEAFREFVHDSTGDNAIGLARCIVETWLRHPAPASPQSDAAQPAGCGVPPFGWRCTRSAGHAGPCAAVRVEIPFGGRTGETSEEYVNRINSDAAQPASSSAPTVVAAVAATLERAGEPPDDAQRMAVEAVSSAPAVGGVLAYLVTNLPSGEPALCFEDERGDYGDEFYTPVFTPLGALAAPTGAAGQDAALLRLARLALESCGSAAVEDGGQQWFNDELVDAAYEAITAALAAQGDGGGK